MTKQEYQAKLKIFMDCCRHYENQMDRRDRILMEHAKAKYCLKKETPESELDRLELQLLEDNIQYVERILTRIGKKFGENPKQILSRIYIKGESLNSLAKENYISERTMTRYLRKWLENCL